MSYEKSYVEFPNGQHMPIVGLGTWSGSPEEMKLAIKTALNVGYRHIDTAFLYENEKAIGEALKEVFAEGKIKREDLFIVTKLPPNGMRPSDVQHFLKASLANLQLDYVDLYLIHKCIGFHNIGDNNYFALTPEGNYLMDVKTDLPAVWKAMEEMVSIGLTKAIGVSNWSANQLQRILDMCRVKPANIQVECHAYFQQDDLVNFCHKNGITVCAYAPIGSPYWAQFLEKERGLKVDFPHLLSDPLIAELAQKHKKEPAQILLRFLMQRGIAVIPKSTNPKRIQSNFDVFDFKLEPSDVQAICKLDRRLRMFKVNDIPGVENHPEYEGYLLI